MQCRKIIPQQETSGNYNQTAQVAIGDEIIPQQETSGNTYVPERNDGVENAGCIAIQRIRADA